MRNFYGEDEHAMAEVGSFKAEFDFDRRSEVAKKMREKYPDRIPVIVEKAPKAQVPNCQKKKFLVPHDLPVGNFLYEIRRNMEGLEDSKAIFLFIDNTLPSASKLMSALYEEHKDDDGFLYITYGGDNVFGYL